MTDPAFITLDTDCSIDSRCRLNPGHDGCCRGYRGKPLILPPGGRRRDYYVRTTTFVSAIEDTEGLTNWKRHMVAIGMRQRPDLLLQVPDVRPEDPDGKRALTALCEDAHQAAGGNDKRDHGTLMHLLSELDDHGGDLPVTTSPQDRRAVAAYQRATKGAIHHHIEAMTVLDAYKVAGTPDRISHWPHPDPDGVTDVGRILDLKTGRMDFGQLKMAGQLAAYAHGDLYDHDTGTRTQLPDVSRKWGVIIDLDIPTATCQWHWIDLQLGWTVVTECALVRALRRAAKNALVPGDVPAPDLAGLIDMAASADDLRALYADHADTWTDDLTALAKKRIDHLAATAA